MDNKAALESILSHKDKLPTLPGIAIKILEAVQKERPDLNEIAEILATDPPLSAEVLRLINSSLYSLPRSVTSVFHAVSMLGLNTIKNLALSFALVKGTRSQEADAFDYTQFWKNSLTVAVASRSIAEKVAPEATEDAFFMGLLHDMGALTLANCMPDQYNLVIREMKQEACTQDSAETQVLGFDHMAVGYYLLDSWGLPEQFCLPVSCHHDPGKLETNDPGVLKMCRILHLATLYMDLFSDDHHSPCLGMIDHFAKEYGFDDTLDVDSAGVRILEQTGEIFPFFELTLENENERLEIVDRARAELIQVSGNFIDQLLEQQQQIQALRRQATHDGLTQLMNYQCFYETLSRELARSQRSHTPLTVIMCDIDHFKSVNDTYGHLAGDRAIELVAKQLKSGLRETDIIARYGGEEFAMVLYNVLPEDAIVVADRIRESISEVSIQFEDQTFQVTMSFGIATMYSDDTIDREGLLNRADKALYQAKTGGRNCCRIFQSAPSGMAVN